MLKIELLAQFFKFNNKNQLFDCLFEWQGPQPLQTLFLFLSAHLSSFLKIITRETNTEPPNVSDYLAHILQLSKTAMHKHPKSIKFHQLQANTLDTFSDSHFCSLPHGTNLNIR